MKRYLEKFFPNKKKFFLSIFLIFLFFLILFLSIKFFEHKKISEKNLEIKEILIWSIEEYKNKSGEYPENLKQIEEFGIINDINILKNKEKINYKKNINGYKLEIN